MSYNHRFEMPSALFILALMLSPAQAERPSGTPLTQERVIQLSKGPLKAHPEVLKKLISKHGVEFFPTKTTLGRLAEEHVDQSVLDLISQRVGHDMRIKVCQFAGDDDSHLAVSFRKVMINALKEAKQKFIPPFGSIPFEETPGPEEACAANVTPQGDALFYFVIEGSIQKARPSGFAIKADVIYRDPLGNLQPLQSADNQPPNFSGDMDSAAEQVISRAIATIRKFAES